MADKPRIGGINDTSPEAEAVQLRILRALTPSQKIDLVEDANRTARMLALAGIRLRHPEATEAEQVRLLMDLVLGEELAARAYGPRPEGVGK